MSTMVAPRTRPGLGDMALRIGIAAGTLLTGYLHAQLFLRGYWLIPTIGPAFLVQAAGSFAVAALLLLGGPGWLRLAAAALSIGALGGFVLSRTVGVAGFTEHGWQPAPQAWLSVAAECLVVVLALVSVAAWWSAHKRGGNRRPRAV